MYIPSKICIFIKWKILDDFSFKTSTVLTFKIIYFHRRYTNNNFHKIQRIRFWYPILTQLQIKCLNLCTVKCNGSYCSLNYIGIFDSN